MKKCRARYGLDQQSQWCKPCRRKKKCIRYMDGGDEADHSEDNLGSAGSVGETRSPDSKADGDSDSNTNAEEDEEEGVTSASDLGLSSPGLSLSSLASPAVLPSPSTSLASPCPLTPSPATPSSSYHDKVIAPPPPPPPPSNSSANNNSSSQLYGPGPSSSGYHHGPHHHQQQQLQQQHLAPPPHRHPIGTNPHDVNNPLSVNQLTSQCSSSKDKSNPKPTDANSHAIVSVT